MNTPAVNTWQSVQAEVRRRIQTRLWKPGEMIPNEADLAAELGCARGTVNRALRALSDEGLIERRRKAGSRVALHPVRRATLDIPMIRKEIEGQNKTYGYALINRATTSPPPAIGARMQGEGANFLHLRSLHMANGAPYVFEDRWINAQTVPAVLDQDFEALSPNEWLLTHAPYTHGDIAFGAAGATAEMAELLGCETGAPCFTIERATWISDHSVTLVAQTFAPGYRMFTQL